QFGLIRQPTAMDIHDLPAPWTEYFLRYQNETDLLLETSLEIGNTARYYELSISTVKQGGDKAIARMFQLHDISHRLQSKKDLETQVERFDLASHAAHMGVWDWDVVNNQLVWDDQMYKLYGVTKEEFSGAHEAWLAGLHPEDRERSDQISKQALNGEIEYDTEFRVLWPDGSVKHLRAFGHVIRDAQGKPLRMTGINYDITAIKESEAAILKSAAQYRLLTENMKDVIWILDAETLLFRYISPSIERLRGFKPEEIIGFSVEEAVMPQTRQLVRDLIHQRVADLLSGKVPSEQFYTEELRQPCKDGSSVWTEVITSYYINPETNRVEVRGATRDISERKKAELEISLKDDLLHLTGEMAKVGGWEFHVATGNGTWTDEVARIHDLDPNEPTNVELGTSFYTGESRTKIEQAIQAAVELGQSYDLELELTTARGTHKWVRTMGKPIVENGKTVKVQGIFQDITERKEYEEALRKEQYLMNVLMDTLPDAIFFKDLQNRFVRINQAQADNLGVADPDLALGKTDRDFFTPEHALPAELDEQKIIQTGQPQLNYEELLTYSDRPSEWVLVTKMPLHDLNGEIIGTFGLSRKITELKRNQEKLRETHDYLENLINYANAPIIVWDPQNVITRFNHAFEKLTGYLSEEVVGKDLAIILPQEHQNESLALIQQTANGEQWESVEIPVQHRDGSNRIVLWNSANILAADGKTVISTIAQGQDITERKRMEEELRDQEQSFRAIFEQAA
ncbi:MAG: PAS domain S-box protein, partial [Anaerolineaceae bacterium]|nr:PAS domain S-box protein [Anaerolineaceae bacterium]